ncbi:MAG: alanine racemase [Ruminococcaceae bacterium]|nr:alanine racemase [Oscillospiraceae bacterium]
MEKMTKELKTWCNINLDAIAHNYKYTCSRTDSAVICVIKANAYGHGAVPIARRLYDEGCRSFAVSSIEEALELRLGGITDCCILVLGYVLPCRIKEAVENDISFALASYDFAKQLCETDTEKAPKVHIKLNTGMNRTGFTVCHNSGYQELAEAIELIRENNIEVEGVFSHFAKAEDDTAFSQKQWGYFENAVDFIKSKGVSPKVIHICNSMGTYNYPSMHLDAVRLGIHLYGCSSDDKNYLPAMDFYTRIVDIHTLKEGDGVSYGLDFIADKEMKIAVIGAGYADGIFRCLSDGKGYVLVRGKKCPILGRVCMDMTMIDISHVPDAKVCDVVTIWGEGLSADEQAKNAGTISYELLCSVAPRVTRVY